MSVCWRLIILRLTRCLPLSYIWPHNGRERQKITSIWVVKSALDFQCKWLDSKPILKNIRTHSYFHLDPKVWNWCQSGRKNHQRRQVHHCALIALNQMTFGRHPDFASYVRFFTGTSPHPRYLDLCSIQYTLCVWITEILCPHNMIYFATSTDNCGFNVDFTRGWYRENNVSIITHSPDCIGLRKGIRSVFGDLSRSRFLGWVCEDLKHPGKEPVLQNCVVRLCRSYVDSDVVWISVGQDGNERCDV